MSLELLQKLRAQTVESVMMELAQITSSLTQSEERARDMEARIEQNLVLYDRQAAQGLTVEMWWEWQGRMESQQAALNLVRREIQQAVAAWQQTKARLVEASQERKLLDLVADKRREAQRVDETRREQRATDETASRRYSTGRERHS
jgi:flagellar FliJ protein